MNGKCCSCKKDVCVCVKVLVCVWVWVCGRWKMLRRARWSRTPLWMQTVQSLAKWGLGMSPPLCGNLTRREATHTPSLRQGDVGSEV